MHEHAWFKRHLLTTSALLLFHEPSTDKRDSNGFFSRRVVCRSSNNSYGLTDSSLIIAVKLMPLTCTKSVDLALVHRVQMQITILRLTGLCNSLYFSIILLALTFLMVTLDLLSMHHPLQTCNIGSTMPLRGLHSSALLTLGACAAGLR